MKSSFYLTKIFHGLESGQQVIFYQKYDPFFLSRSLNLFNVSGEIECFIYFQFDKLLI